MTALALPPIDADPPRGRLWAFLNPFTAELDLRGASESEVLRRAREPARLIDRYGWRRALAFWRRQLLPALERLATDVQCWRARFEVGCWALALEVGYRPSASLLRGAGALARELPQARFADDRHEHAQSRRQVRDFLTAKLARTAEQLAKLRDERGALAAYEQLDHLGLLSPVHRESYARLLWRRGDRGPRAVAIYLRHLQTLDRGAGDAIPGLAAFVADQLRIDEHTPASELPRRLRWNQMALAGSRAPAEARLHIGLGYLGLAQPERALGYLRRSAERADDKKQAPACFHLGRALYLTGAVAEAHDAFERAEHAGYPRARIAAWQGMTLAREGRYDEAETLFTEAEPTLDAVCGGELYVQWGRARFLSGDAAGAEQRFGRARELDPGERRALHGQAIALEQQGSLAPALELLRHTVTAEEPFTPLLYRRGRLAQAAGETDEALHWYRRAVERASEDPGYALALGLLLDEQGAAEALAHLERAAAAQTGGSEVLRRLALGYRRQGRRDDYRRWLERWARLPGVGEEVIRFHARELVAAATEAFNTRAYARAVQLARRAVAVLPQDPPPQQWLARILLADAVTRLRDGGEDVWQQIEQAHALWATAETRFYRAIGLLARGELAAAHDELRALADEHPEVAEHALFADLAAALGGDEQAAERLAARQIAAPSLQSLLELVLLRRAMLHGDFARAAELVKSWIETAEKAAALALPRHQLNLLAATCLWKGTRTRRQQLLKLFASLAPEKLSFWAFARLRIRHRLATLGGQGQSSQERQRELDELDATYRELHTAAGDPAERTTLGDAWAELVRARLQEAITAGNLVAAQDLCEQLRGLEPASSKHVEALSKALKKRLREPSHALAYGQRASDPEAARRVWQTLWERDGDLLALHHLACHAWLRAHDAFGAGEIDAAAELFREALCHYGRLYASETFWGGLETKGRALASPGHPFDESAFATWRRDAPFLLGEAVLRLVFGLVLGGDAGVDPAENLAQVKKARKLVVAIRGSELGPETIERLGAALARHYLDPDPTRLSNYEAALDRARRVLDLDPDSSSARSFLVRAATHHASTEREASQPGFRALAKHLEEQTHHAEWLTTARTQLPEERQQQLTSDLAAFYHELGMVRHLEGNDEAGRFNTTRPSSPSAARSLLERISACYRTSDKAFQSSLQLQSFNPTAEEYIQRHEDEYATIEPMLKQLRMLR